MKNQKISQEENKLKKISRAMLNYLDSTSNVKVQFIDRDQKQKTKEMDWKMASLKR